MTVRITLPGEMPPDRFFDTRYEVLRRPLGAPRGSERIAGDDNALNVWAEVDGVAAAVGRAHLIPICNDGSVIDVAAKSACPPFGPLAPDFVGETDDSGTIIPANLRPAFQVRQMGTLERYRGQGLAAEVLQKLEAEAMRLWNVRSGWLQARLVALPFYAKQGWTCFGPAYDVPNVGPHRNMWKDFR
ncbi:MAG: GNAT family N-acetyltransferase [Flavobacteriales bacterium]|nr:GNAT family N-acetyltransferase [Flavobacteriales bacterium]